MSCWAVTVTSHITISRLSGHSSATGGHAGTVTRHNKASPTLPPRRLTDSTGRRPAAPARRPAAPAPARRGAARGGRTRHQLRICQAGAGRQRRRMSADLVRKPGRRPLITDTSAPPGVWFYSRPPVITYWAGSPVLCLVSPAVITNF